MAKRGHVERLPSGRYRARLGRETVGTYDTEEQARVALDGGTLAAVWPDFVVARRAQGIRDVPTDESRWELYCAADPISEVPLPDLRRRHAKQWLVRMQGRGLAPQTIRNAMTLLRLVCEEAVDLELLSANPFTGMRLRRQADAQTHEGWTILDPDEQLALLRAVDEDEAAMVAFALFTGMRNSELWALRTRDIDLDTRTVTVRYSKGDKPTKGGKIRRVPLIGAALVSAQVAVERGSKFAWPSPRTRDRRYHSSHPTRWRKWLEAAGITRRVRWYDLRHTCATSLLAGWWGRKWSLDEVRQMLGHSTVRMTERYAHLVDDSLQRAGAATTGPTAWGDTVANSGTRTPDLRFTKPGFEQRFSTLASIAILDAYDRQSELTDEAVLWMDPTTAGGSK